MGDRHICSLFFVWARAKSRVRIYGFMAKGTSTVEVLKLDYINYSIVCLVSCFEMKSLYVEQAGLLIPWTTKHRFTYILCLFWDGFLSMVGFESRPSDLSSWNYRHPGHSLFKILFVFFLKDFPCVVQRTEPWTLSTWALYNWATFQNVRSILIKIILCFSVIKKSPLINRFLKAEKTLVS